MVRSAMGAPVPFVFLGGIELREMLGVKARDERELMEHLERVPVESIFYHTHSVFLRRQVLPGGYPNDFATWVGAQVRDQVLAERLAVVDPFEYGSLETLREDLVSIVDAHIASLNPVPRVVFGEPFFFVRSHLIQVPTGLQARTLAEFRDCLAQVDASAIFLHALEARVRRGVPGGDFAAWLAEALGLPALGEAVGRVNPYGGGLERMRADILRLLAAHA
jgi:hypothetical protein